MFVAIRSAWIAVATTSLAIALLLAELGSVVEELTVAVSLIAVPEATLAFTVTTKLIVALVLAARLEIVQVRVPRLHVQPAGPVKDVAVVFAGVASVKITLAPAVGPALATTCV
jgi:hypothetical protein